MEQKTVFTPERLNKRIHVALPVRFIVWDSENRPTVEWGCTYDISSRGARVTGLRSIQRVGEVVAIERGRNKVYCRVIWIGEPKSELQGQMGIESVEAERTMFDQELRDMEETYDPVGLDLATFRTEASGGGNRRRLQRFTTNGRAELLKEGILPTGGFAELKDLSELGCLVSTPQILDPGTDLKLLLNVNDHELSMRGKVRHAAQLGTGIEFREIRKGDRQLLNYLLRKLAEEEMEKSLIESHP
jgi:PilZ domain-containing protein